VGRGTKDAGAPCRSEGYSLRLRLYQSVGASDLEPSNAFLSIGFRAVQSLGSPVPVTWLSAPS
jgi:hypothetical protein